jgi:hypothetical protein
VLPPIVVAVVFDIIAFDEKDSVGIASPSELIPLPPAVFRMFATLPRCENQLTLCKTV